MRGGKQTSRQTLCNRFAHLRNRYFIKTYLSCTPNPCCPPNYSGSGVIGVPDIFMFLSDWFAGCP